MTTRPLDVADLVSGSAAGANWGICSAVPVSGFGLAEHTRLLEILQPQPPLL
jgi:hypothetical protein